MPIVDAQVHTRAANTPEPPWRQWADPQRALPLTTDDLRRSSMTGRLLKTFCFAVLSSLAYPAPDAVAATASPVRESTSAPQDSVQTYPVRAVRIVLGYSPGGSDVVTRMIMQRLSEKLGQPFVIDYRPGASATVGTDVVAKSVADGYTLLFATGTFAITAVTFQKLPYDTIRDFAPIAFIGSVPMVLATHPSLPVTSVKEFIAFAKARPGLLDYSSAGSGGGYHLSTLVFAAQTGIRVTHVPYKGSNPAVTALISGEVQFMFPNLIAALPHVRTGKLKALGIASAERSPLAPDLPTMHESGVPSFREGTWYGVLAPRGTPSSVITLLNQEIAAALQTKSIRESLEKLGIVVSAVSTPADFSNLIRSDIEKWDRVLKAAGNPAIDRF
jgi:tripartite-type tricarboxylate transporter receptor subunit TctC